MKKNEAAITMLFYMVYNHWLYANYPDSGFVVSVIGGFLLWVVFWTIAIIGSSIVTKMENKRMEK